MALRIRRGTDAERQIIIPLAGELIYTTDTKQLFVGDGTTSGGIPVGSLLAADLDLNGNNITGNGNININGTITATGNINLGDGAEDNVIVGGQISSDLVPAGDIAYKLGTAAKRWQGIWTAGMVVDGAITAGSITANVIAQDSTVLVNTAEGTVNAAALSGIIGNDIVGGSLYSTDSSLIVDGMTGTLHGTLVGNSTGTHQGDVVNSDSTLVISADQAEGTFTNLFTSSIRADQGADGFVNIYAPDGLNVTADNTTSIVRFKGLTDGVGGDGGTPFFDFQGVRGSFDNPQQSQAGDLVGALRFLGTDSNGDGLTTLLQYSYIDPSANMADDTPLSYGLFGVPAGDGNGTNGFVGFYMKGSGAFQADVLQANPIDGARRAQITPEAGMIWYNAEADKFQGYVEDTGDSTPGWVDLH